MNWRVGAWRAGWSGMECTRNLFLNGPGSSCSLKLHHCVSVVGLVSACKIGGPRLQGSKMHGKEDPEFWKSRRSVLRGLHYYVFYTKK